MKLLNRLILISLLLVILDACTEDDADPFVLNATSAYKGDVAHDWLNLQLNLVKSTGGFSPPVAARSYGYAALALYETVVPGIKGNASYSGLINGYTRQGVPNIEKNKNYNWELAANASMAYMMRNQFRTSATTNLALIDQLEQTYITKNNSTDTAMTNRSIAFGKAVAEAVYNFSKTDNQDSSYKTNFPDYTIPNDPWKWEPTSPTNLKPLQPYWGEVRPFLTKNVENSLIESYVPIDYSTDPKSVFYQQANEVYIAGINLSPAQTATAKYWSDDPGLTGTPPGHSMSIASQTLQSQNANLALTAEVFSKVGLAVHDAFISCWKCKFKYNLIRPVTYINRYIDPNFKTLLATPPFPEHTSGHSVQTAAAMTVLETYFGYNYHITDRTHELRTDIIGTPRVYNSFGEIADEAAISRLYGGIHYRQAIERGIDQGRIIGINIAAIKLN